MHEMKYCSQHGEDGIIDYIFSKIGVTNQYFVEFGAETGLENNTAHLASHKHWGGLLIEGDINKYKQLITVTEILSRINNSRNITTQYSFVTAENINNIFSENNVPNKFDFLSIDIDGNDYYIWKALRNYRPRLVVIEYNATFAPPLEWVQKYDSNYTWDGSFLFGASLKSLEILGKELGYSLIGTESFGVNAFFLQTEICNEFGFNRMNAEDAYSPPSIYFRFLLFSHSFAVFCI